MAMLLPGLLNILQLNHCHQNKENFMFFHPTRVIGWKSIASYNHLDVQERRGLPKQLFWQLAFPGFYSLAGLWGAFSDIIWCVNIFGNFFDYSLISNGLSDIIFCLRGFDRLAIYDIYVSIFGRKTEVTIEPPYNSCSCDIVAHILKTYQFFRELGQCRE